MRVFLEVVKKRILELEGMLVVVLWFVGFVIGGINVEFGVRGGVSCCYNRDGIIGGGLFRGW